MKSNSNRPDSNVVRESCDGDSDRHVVSDALLNDIHIDSGRSPPEDESHQNVEWILENTDHEKDPKTSDKSVCDVMDHPVYTQLPLLHFRVIICTQFCPLQLHSSSVRPPDAFAVRYAHVTKQPHSADHLLCYSISSRRGSEHGKGFSIWPFFRGTNKPKCSQWFRWSRGTFCCLFQMTCQSRLMTSWWVARRRRKIMWNELYFLSDVATTRPTLHPLAILELVLSLSFRKIPMNIKKLQFQYFQLGKWKLKVLPELNTTSL